MDQLPNVGQMHAKAQLMRTLRVWVPTNRVDERGRYTHVDGWNEIIEANRSGYRVGAIQERDNVQHVALWTRLAMQRQRWPVMTKDRAVPCKVTITFVERDRRRDVGNVHGGSKYALDGITRRHKYGAGAIYDDSQRWLPEIDYRIAYVGDDHAEPGIEITITTLED